jgi:hypothetical protein
MKRFWLRDWPWETVVTINATLCKEKKALHKPTSDGHDSAKKIWESARARELTLREVLDLCRHRPDDHPGNFAKVAADESA